MFLARFRSQANMCSNSVPTAALAGVRTLCQQQSQGKCWHTERANSRRGCANVRTDALVWHHQHLCDARELGEARPVRACPTGRHHASAVALHAEAVRAVGGVGVGGDIAER